MCGLGMIPWFANQDKSEIKINNNAWPLSLTINEVPSMDQYSLEVISYNSERKSYPLSVGLTVLLKEGDTLYLRRDGLNNAQETIPTRFEVMSNYPNPFLASTTIRICVG